MMSVDRRAGRRSMQLSLDVLEVPAPLAHLWEAFNEEQRRAAARLLAALMARAVVVEEEEEISDE
jgi:hypothetical protein